MIAKDLVSQDLLPLQASDTVSKALQLLEDWKVDTLPVVEDRVLKGYVNEAFLLEHDDDASLASILHILPVLPKLPAEQHLFDCLKLLNTCEYDVLAVENEEGKVIGLISDRTLLKALDETLMVSQAGSIMVLEVKPQDYMLSEISRIIEYNDARILGFTLVEKPNSNIIDVHLKLNVVHLKNILATLERYNYKVVQYFSREDLAEDLDDRYKSFMKYLDI